MCTNAGGGGSSGGATQARKIYSQILEQGLNSNIPGIREKAKNGTGNYAFKGATPVSFDKAQLMEKSSMKALTRGENTLVDGVLPNGKHIYYAGKTDSPQIQFLLDKRKNKTDTSRGNTEAKGTTTYDRWYSNNRKKFSEWFYGGQNKK